MADGTSKPIERVKIGDKVLATDPETGKSEIREVTAEIKGQGLKHLVKVTIDVDGGKGNRTAAVTATDGHPFWVPELRAWIDANDLKPGERLRTSAGRQVGVDSVERWTEPAATVHNLTVSDLHTYYVLAGAAPVLVHNDGSPDVLRGCDISVQTRMVTNSAGEEVARHTVESEDDLLGIADHFAGGSLDNFANRKPDFWRGTLPDGTHRDIEFNLEGHRNPPEGPHVKLSELEDNSRGVSKGNKWNVVFKVFIRGRETR